MAGLIQTLEYILHSHDPSLPKETKSIVLKEGLGAYVLEYLYNHSEYRRLNFYGGTCLHVVYQLKRFSDDLDLDNSREVDISSLAEDLVGYFKTRLGFPGASTGTQKGAWGVSRITFKFPVLFELGLSSHTNEQLHLKVEISSHQQTAIIQHTPVLYHGRSFVPSHFSLETMMAGKMLACSERSFSVGNTGIHIKGRDYYDLLWFMGQGIRPLEKKLQRDGQQAYTIQSAMAEIQEKIKTIKKRDLAHDLLPLFENRAFIEAWLGTFHEQFELMVGNYL